MSSLFEQKFGRAPEAVGSAHGRVNLMGDHTDYNGGFVLPICIPQATRVELARRNDRIVRVASESMGDTIEEFSLDELVRGNTWTDYVKGVVHVSGSELGITGFDSLIQSTVPVGAGLSSSAALEVSLLRALRSLSDAALSDVDIAGLGRRAENEFVGAPVGIMDQMAASVGDENHALFLDTRTLSYERIPIPDSLGVIVIDSGVKHSHASGSYRDRRRECEEAAEMLKVMELRDVACIDDANMLPEPLRQRAYHVITENARVLAMVSAFKSGNFSTLGQLLRKSHESLQFDFEVSTSEVDELVQVANEINGVYGARITGGGFGGCIVAIAERAVAGPAAEAIARNYHARTGRKANVVVPDGGSA